MNKKINRTILCIILFYTGLALHSEEMNNDSTGIVEYNSVVRKKYKTDGMFKIGSGVNSSELLCLNFQAGIQVNKITIAFQYMPGFELNAMNFTSLNPRESNELFAIKVSYKPSDEPFSLSYFTGIGVYSSTSRGDFIWSEGFIFVVEYYKTINLSRIVVPLGIELNYRMKSISISLSAEAYIADMRPVYTFMLNYTFHI